MIARLCLLFLFLAPSTEGADRRPQYVLEVLFAWEPQLAKNLLHLDMDIQTAKQFTRDYIQFTIEQVNEYFETFSVYGIDIRVQPLHLYEIEEVVLPPYSYDSFRRLYMVSQSMALAQFYQWLSKEVVPKNIKFDAAILFTGFRFREPSKGVAIRPDKKVITCTDMAFGVVRFEFSQTSIYVTAHELGHLLGILHDEPPQCAGVLRRSRSDSWAFSICSARALNRTIRALDTSGSNCLLHTTSQATSYGLSKVMRQRGFYDLNKTCQHILLHKGAHFSPKGGQRAGGDSLCSEILTCRTRGYLTNTFTAPNWIACAKDKVCLGGKCVPLPDQKQDKKGTTKHHEAFTKLVKWAIQALRNLFKG